MEASLLEFPCDFPLKIMGAARDDFAQTIAAVVKMLESLPYSAQSAAAEHLRDYIAEILAPIPTDGRDSWSRLSLENLARAYGDDEPEYSLEDTIP